jgi:ATP:ADP antiporter, AAA family
MRDRLFSLLGIESGEESMVSMLLTQSVFLGIFFGAFDISAHSLFLSIFDEKMMARGYVVSGIAGIILTSLYTWLQTRMKFKNFAVLNLIIVTLLTLVLWVALIINPAKWIVFLVFIMLGPLNILAMLGFWGTTGRLFTLRQGKRLFGLVDVGMIIGIIISCYTIPVLLSFKFESHNILLVSSSCGVIATIIQIMMRSSFSMTAGGGERVTEKSKEKQSVLSVFRKDPYTRTMAIFIALSVMTAFFVQYSFMAVTREQYPAEEDMARFLGIFIGSMMIFTLLIKLLVFSYLIRNYGLRTCLAISPILIAVFTMVAISIGMFMGYTPEATSGFLIFFMLLALSRLFSKSLKDSIESPSFKVIYQTIDEKIRYAVQSGMDGTVNEIAALSSGLLLAGLGILSFIKLIHFSLVLFFIILVWIFVAFRLYTEYRKSIRKALETSVDGIILDNLRPENDFLKNRYFAERAFRSDYFNLITGNYSQLENNKNNWYFKRIIDYSGVKNDTCLIPVLKKLASNIQLNEDIRRQSAEMAKKVEQLKLSGKREDDRIVSAKSILSGTRLPQTTEILRLLRDNSLESKRLGIFMIGKFRLTDMLPEVCECLNIQGLETDASSVLQTFGKESFSELERFYLVSSGNPNTSKTILRLLGKVKTNESLGFLFARLWSNSRQLKEVALKCLIECEFKPSEEDRDRLHQYISDIIGVMTWNLSAKICLAKSGDTFLLDVLNKEISRWSNFLFNILSITYDAGSITKIRENLGKETVESVNFALEMIDIVIEDSIKPKLIPLLDITSDEDKLKNLYQFFPGEVPKYNKLLENIINRDYNLLSLWTKACTLRNLPEIDGDDMAESVVALLFSPEGIIQEESAKLIARSSKELYKTASLRIAEATKKRLDNIVNGETDQMDLVFEKVKFLSDCFKGIPEEEFLSMAGSMKYVKDPGSLKSVNSDNYLFWYLSDKKQVTGITVHLDEQINGSADRFQVTEIREGYILPLSAVEEYHYQFPDKSFEILRYIDNNEA